MSLPERQFKNIKIGDRERIIRIVPPHAAYLRERSKNLPSHLPEIDSDVRSKMVDSSNTIDPGVNPLINKLRNVFRRPRG